MANTPTQNRANRIKKKYRKVQGINQTGSGIVGDLAKLGVRMGSKAINSVFGKKIDRQRSKTDPKSLQVQDIKNKKKCSASSEF